MSLQFLLSSYLACLFALNYFVDPVFAGAGVITSVFTPSDKDGNIMLDVIPEYARFLKNNSVHGILVAGIAGECQRKRLLDSWLKAARSVGLAIIMQVGGMPLLDVKDMAWYSEKVGVDGIMSLPPQYYKPATPEELVDVMMEISQAAPNTPLLYYDRPSFTQVNVDMHQFYRMANEKINNFSGISCDLEVAIKVQREVKNGQRLYVAGALSQAAGVLFGFDTFLNTESNLIPKILTDICKYGLQGDIATTRKLHKRVRELNWDLSRYGPLETTAKVAMKTATGIDVGYTREPIPRLNSTQVKAIRAQWTKLGVDV